MKELTYVKRIDDIDLLFSSDYKTLKEYDGIGPAVQVITSENFANDSYGAEFSDGLKYAVMADSLEELKLTADDDYCRKVVARYYGESLVIRNTTRLVIKEISIADMDDISEMYADAPFLENFFENAEDLKQVIKRYINDVYCFYDYGIWGIYLADTDEMIGMAGFTPRESVSELIEKSKSSTGVMDIKGDKDSNILINILQGEHGEAISLELCYAIKAKYQSKGYAFEACLGIIGYAIENIEFSQIFVNVSTNNIASINLAKKIKLSYGNVNNIKSNE